MTGAVLHPMVKLTCKSPSSLHGSLLRSCSAACTGIQVEQWVREHQDASYMSRRCLSTCTLPLSNTCPPHALLPPGALGPAELHVLVCWRRPAVPVAQQQQRVWARLCAAGPGPATHSTQQAACRERWTQATQMRRWTIEACSYAPAALRCDPPRPHARRPPPAAPRAAMHPALPFICICSTIKETMHLLNICSASSLGRATVH